MSKIVAITGICAALMCCFSCSSSGTLSKNAPRWVTSPDEVYPASLYLNGVGSGSDRRSAENDAVAVLARSIRQQITAATSASETFDTTYLSPSIFNVIFCLKVIYKFISVLVTS